MQTLTRPKKPDPNFRPQRARRKRFSPLMLISMAVTTLIVIGAGTYFVVLPLVKSHAAAANPNMDCTLTVPANPLSAQGLATPYQLVATDAANGPCNEVNANQSAFVQGAIFDPATGKISVYNPLVIDQGTKPAVAPTVPQLPANAVVALWFGFNGNNLTLQSTNNSLADGKCVNGADGTIFGQFAYCNAPNFFTAANKAIAAGQLVPPALGQAADGMTCPTTRDFAVVDQDQSDNVTTKYLANANGQIAQMNAANANKLPGATVLGNPSDNGLLSNFVDKALQCTPWMAPDLANNGAMVPALPLNELQAAAHQNVPIALVPNMDPMVLNNNKIDNNKVNAYRSGVNQPAVSTINSASTKTYCQNLVNVGAPHLVIDAPLTAQVASPAADVGNTLFTFLASRFSSSYTILTCQKLLGKQSPIAVKTDANGVAISATFKGIQINTQGPANNPNIPNCAVNNQTVQKCMGTVMFNNQTCMFMYDPNTNQVSITCNAEMNPPGNGNGNNGNANTGTGNTGTGNANNGNGNANNANTGTGNTGTGNANNGNSNANNANAGNTGNSNTSAANNGNSNANTNTANAGSSNANANNNNTNTGSNNTGTTQTQQGGITTASQTQQGQQGNGAMDMNTMKSAQGMSLSVLQLIVQIYLPPAQ